MIKIAIAVTGGHVARAIDFYKSPNKYFIIGGTKVWSDINDPAIDESNPPSPGVSTYKLNDVIGLVEIKSNDVNLVVPDDNGSIPYRSKKWRIVNLPNDTTTKEIVPAGTNTISLNSLEGIAPGIKVRVNNSYDGIVGEIIDDRITLINDKGLPVNAPEDIPANSIVSSGALVEGAKYVHMKCTLNHDYNFPVVDNQNNKVTYRQVGICTGVKGVSRPSEDGSLYSAGYKGNTSNDYTSLGILEILDNRPPSTRDINQVETLSLVVEF